MKKILFIAEDLTLAHVIRPYVLAKSLDQNKYEIIFATGKKYQSFIKNLDSRIITIPTLSSDLFLDRLARGKPIYTTDEIQTSVTSDLELFAKTKPDLVVGDFRLSLGISAPKAGIPYVSLTNAFWSKHSTLPFPVPELPIVHVLGVTVVRALTTICLPYILKLHAKPFNRVRKAYGLPVFSDLKEVYTHGDRVLYLDTPLLAPTSHVPDNHHYIGPLIWSPDDPLPSWWDTLPTDKPVVYVTMGSSGDIRVVENIVTAIAELGLTGIVSTAGRFDSMNLAGSIFEETFLPGTEAAKRADIVICSGGTATTYQALACGTPVIGVPFNADQYLCMEGVARQGAGILIRSGKLTRKDVTHGLTTMLHTPSFKENALKIQQEMAAFDAEKLFSEYIDRLTGQNTKK